MKKDLLSIRDLTKDEILFFLSEARTHKPKVKDMNLRDNSLGGVSITTLFYENSTRTKMSFLLAGEYLGAYADDLNVSTSSVNKGETLIDTGLNLDAMGTNVIVIRHGMTGAAHLLARNVKASVINGGDGSNEHPTQALLDLFTIQEYKGDFKNLKVVIVGDIANSRVARSNVFGLTKLGAKVVLAGPSTLISGAMRSLGDNIEVTTNVAEAIKDADVVMGLRIQLERQKTNNFPSLEEYHKFFGVTAGMIDVAKHDALIMHPGPVNRGVELCTDLIDGNRSVILNQVENGLAVRMAVLNTLVTANENNIKTRQVKIARFNNNPFAMAN